MLNAIIGEGGVVNRMVGDGLMAIFGAPKPLPEEIDYQSGFKSVRPQPV